MRRRRSKRRRRRRRRMTACERAQERACDACFPAPPPALAFARQTRKNIRPCSSSYLQLVVKVRTTRRSASNLRDCAAARLPMNEPGDEGHWILEDLGCLACFLDIVSWALGDLGCSTFGRWMLDLGCSFWDLRAWILDLQN